MSRLQTATAGTEQDRESCSYYVVNRKRARSSQESQPVKGAGYLFFLPKRHAVSLPSMKR